MQERNDGHTDKRHRKPYPRDSCRRWLVKEGRMSVGLNSDSNTPTLSHSSSSSVVTFNVVATSSAADCAANSSRHCGPNTSAVDSMSRSQTCDTLLTSISISEAPERRGGHSRFCATQTDRLRDVMLFTCEFSAIRCRTQTTWRR